MRVVLLTSLLIVALMCIYSAGQHGISGNEINLGRCGPPNYACSYAGTDAKPLCTDCTRPEVPDLSAEPNAVWYDRTFGLTNEGNQIVRCTYPDTNHDNRSYSIGFGGSGDMNQVGRPGGSPPTYRLVVGDSDGWNYPFTFTPDPVHPKCEPTYPIGSFKVTDGSFSWITPHLYYAFGGYRYVINQIDLGSASMPERKTVVDFQQILPRDGPDWPGASLSVALGTIIRPLKNNPGKYLFQATCPPRQSTCASGSTGSSNPNFRQATMADTVDGSICWRNIGHGFSGPASWYAIGGISVGDDVFAKAFSDEGEQGGPGAIFVAVYQRGANVFFLYNVGTGIISSFGCKGGSGYSCSGGSWAESSVGMTDLPDRFFLHNLRLNKNGKWLLLELDACALQTCSVIPGGPGMYVWQINATRTKVTKITNHPWGHWTTGFNLLVNQDGDAGVNLNGRTFDGPENQFAVNSFSFSMPQSTGNEAHPSWNYNDGSDSTPVCTATSAFDWPYTIPWQNEVICYGTNPKPDCTGPGHATCGDTVRRFFHTNNPGTCDEDENFNSCYGIGALSQDGNYYAFTSNWGDTLGSTSKGGHGSGSCNGSFNFQVNHSYQVGEAFEPGHRTGNGHPNPNFNVYKVTEAGKSASYPAGRWPQAWSKKWSNYKSGEIILPLSFPNNPCNHYFQVTAGGGSASGTNPPVWKDAYGYKDSCNSVTTAVTIKDGGITWTDMGEYVLGTMHLANMGRDDCRSDVFIGKLN